MRRRRYLILAGGITTTLAGCQTREEVSAPTVDSTTVQQDARQWDAYEITLRNEGSYTNAEKYTQVTLEGTFTDPNGQKIIVPGFWDGQETFRIRFAPPKAGTWTWETASSEASLDGATGSFDAVSPTESEIDANPNLRGFLQPVTTDANRYFEYADGTPFLYAAGSIWDGNSKAMPYVSDFQQYVNDRKSKGFTAIQILIGEPSNDYGGPRNTGNNEGGLLFTGTKSSPDYSEINPRNLQNFDKRVEYIHDEKGMVPNLFFEWGGQYDDQTTEQLQNYYRYIVARYGAYNVLFTVSGEYDLDSYYPKTAKMNDSASHANSVDGLSHPTSIHPSTDPSSSSTDFAGEEWLDYHTHQPGERTDVILLEGDCDTGLPLVNGEPHVANNFGLSRLEVRRDPWQVFTSGRAAGIAHLYYPIAYDYDSVDHLDSLIDAPETQDIARAYRYFDDINWWELIPAQELVLRGQSNEDTSIKVASYLPDGSLELVYYSNNSSATIDLSVLDATKATLHWYRTKDGTTHGIRTFSTSETPTLAPPVGWKDALLVAEPA